MVKNKTNNHAKTQNRVMVCAWKRWRNF